MLSAMHEAKLIGLLKEERARLLVLIAAFGGVNAAYHEWRNGGMEDATNELLERLLTALAEANDLLTELGVVVDA